MSARAGMPNGRRLLVLAPAMVALVAGIVGGLVRAGWAVSPGADSAVAFHGGLMVAGFFGTLIALERAVALGSAWTYAAPLLSGAGAVALLLGAPFPASAALMALGSAVFTAASVRVTMRQSAAFTATMLMGAASLLAGNVLWLAGRPVFELAPWWLFFLVLTVAGERLELSRLVRPPRRAQALFMALAVLAPVAAAAAMRWPSAGAIGCGAVLVALALWLARWDVARRTVRQKALPRYIALCLFAGYAWLLFAGALLVFDAALLPGLRYDAVLHAVFLGFAFSMVFGHAPVIFPAVVRVPLRYSPGLYAPLVLLHGSLALRAAGDLLDSSELRLWGSLGNAAALALFLGFVFTSLVGALAPRKVAPQRRIGRVA